MHITGHRLLLTLDAALEAAGHRRYGRAKTIAEALERAGVSGILQTSIATWVKTPLRDADKYNPAEYDDSLAIVANRHAADPAAILSSPAPSDDDLRARIAGSLGERVAMDEPAVLVDGIISRVPEPDAPIVSDPIEIQGQRIGVLSDVHIPHHDLPALTAAISHLAGSRIDALVLNGDILDMYEVSDFDRNPGHWDLGRAMGQGREFMSYLRWRFPGVPIYYNIGNHEERLRRYIWRNAPALGAMPDLELWQLLRLHEFGGFTFAEAHRPLMAGDLPVIHGHEIKASASLHAVPAQALYNKAREAVMIGHLHRPSSFEGVALVTGRRHHVYTTGCLCSLVPEYARHNKWRHGWAVVEVHAGAATVTLHHP